MRWESIIGFIVIAIISSLFNKGKQQPTSHKPENPSRTGPDPRTVNPPKPKAQENRKPFGWEEMFRELQKDMGEALQGHPQKEQETLNKTQPTDVEKKEKVVEVKKNPPIKREVPDTTQVVMRRRVKGQKVNLDRQAVLQGIIMSEVLGKPKALRNRGNR